MMASRHAAGERQGSAGARSTLAGRCTARATGSHATATATQASEITIRLLRQPSSASASGTASAPLAPAPIWMPNANRPVASSGRCANAVFTSTGASTLPIAMPMPIGSVRAITPSAPGIRARATPASPIVNSTIVMARVAPTRAASGPAAGANTPMQRSGIVSSSPVTVCETPRSLSIESTSGPMAMISGRRASAESTIPASISPGRRAVPTGRSCAIGGRIRADTPFEDVLTPALRR